MELKVVHTTHYTYSEPVDYALQKVRLRPQTSTMQVVHDWSLDITHGRIETGYTDHFGNLVDLVSLEPGAESISVRASGTVQTLSGTGILGKVYGRAPLWHFRQATEATTPGEAIRALPRISGEASGLIGELHDLSAEILKAAPYVTGQTDVATTAEAAMAGGHGVCQDHAQIFCAAARLSHLPARYVSGYLMMNDRVEQDASHAWAEVFVADLGWVGFDVSNGVSPDERYIRIATGRDARDASPIVGLRMGSADETLSVSLQVQQQ